MNHLEIKFYENLRYMCDIKIQLKKFYVIKKVSSLRHLNMLLMNSLCLQVYD